MTATQEYEAYEQARKLLARAIQALNDAATEYGERATRGREEETHCLMMKAAFESRATELRARLDGLVGMSRPLSERASKE